MRTSYLIAIGLGALLACGGSDKRAAEEPASDDGARTGPHRASAPDVDDEVDDGVELEGTKGHLEPHQIEAGVRPHQAALGACYHDQLRAIRFLDGDVEFGFTVGSDGQVTSVRLIRSDLGSWPVERCMLEVGRKLRFARPRGNGEAEFTLPLEFKSGKGNVIWWAEERGEAEAEKYLLELDACSGEHDGGPKNVWLTLYVGPRGEVRSIGFASPAGPIADGWAECVSQRAAAWVLSDPRGQIAKAGFRYRAE